MRGFDEIVKDMDHAFSINDAEALLRCANELDALGTPQAEAAASRSRGWALYLRGDYPAALEYCRRALTLHEVLANRNGVARALSNIGTVLQETGDNPAALEHYHRALALHEELNDLRGVAIVTGNIGLVFSSTGDYPAALEYYHRAQALHDELDDRSSIAHVMSNIGNVYSVTGNYPAALEHYHRALALSEVLGDRRGVAIVTANIGNVHYSTADYIAAVEHYNRALPNYDELGDRFGVALVTSNIIASYLAMGSATQAQALLQVMDTMQIDSPDLRIAREMHRAVLQERNSDADDASSTLQKALADAQNYGLRSLTADVHKSLRDLAHAQNDLAAYVNHNNEYTRITEEINGKDTALKLAMQAKQREIDAERKETEKQLAVLHSTLPKHIADRVARGETVNDHYDSAAVIFLDIVGFTTISDRIPSGHVVYLLEQIFTTLDRVCAKHGVVKIKTIGDSYMAVSFANTENQTPKTEHVVSAGRGAVEMLSALNALEISMPPELGDTAWTKEVGDIQVRIGVHCGPVTAGVIGTQRMQYDVWGDTVNVASRMESSGEPGRIHVSEAFATALRSVDGGRWTVDSRNDSMTNDSMTLFERGTVEIKGKGSMTTYWIEARS